jgi:hypothetical protein
MEALIRQIKENTDGNIIERIYGYNGWDVEVVRSPEHIINGLDDGGLEPLNSVPMICEGTIQSVRLKPLNVFRGADCGGWNFDVKVDGIISPTSLERLKYYILSLEPRRDPQVRIWRVGRLETMPNGWSFEVRCVAFVQQGKRTGDELYAIRLLTPPLARIPLLGFRYGRVELSIAGPLTAMEVRKFLGYLSTV